MEGEDEEGEGGERVYGTMEIEREGRDQEEVGGERVEEREG